MLDQNYIQGLRARAVLALRSKDYSKVSEIFSEMCRADSELHLLRSAIFGVSEVIAAALDQDWCDDHPDEASRLSSGVGNVWQRIHSAFPGLYDESRVPAPPSVPRLSRAEQEALAALLTSKGQRLDEALQVPESRLKKLRLGQLELELAALGRALAIADASLSGREFDAAVSLDDYVVLEAMAEAMVGDSVHAMSRLALRRVLAIVVAASLHDDETAAYLARPQTARPL